MAEDLEIAKSIAVRAGAILLDHFSRVRSLRGRGNGTAREAARRAAAFLIRELKREYPGDGILSEEESEDMERLSKSRVWILDPLDGATPFSNRSGEFTVMIGLAVDGAATLGIVYQPTAQKLYYAELGCGAFVVENRTTRLLRVSRESNPALMTLAVAPPRAPADIGRVQGHLGIHHTLCIASMGLRIGEICEARAHCCLDTSRHTMQWETCAPLVLLHEAGGRMTGMRNEPLPFNTPEVRNLNGLVASNGRIHDQIVNAAQAALAEQLVE